VSERFLIRTEGGPRPGTKAAEGIGWPLPELLLWEGGVYVKAAESPLPPQDGGSHLLRGAEYRWQETDATAAQLASAIAVEISARRLEEAVGLMHLLALRDPEMAQGVMDMIEIAQVAAQ
jgi:hypothetical protein